MIMLMQPQQPDYNFIVNPAQKAKKPLLPRGNSTQARIFVVLGGVIALLIIGVVVSSLISSGGKAQKETLLKAAQQQAELIRVSNIGITKARDPSARNFASTTSLTLQSDQRALLVHVKASAKELALGKNTKNDIALTEAEQSNNFDAVFTQMLKTQLTTYEKTLKNAYDGASSKKTKATLADEYNHANTLVTKE